MSCKNKETFAFWTLEYLHWPTKDPSHCPSSFSSFFSLINNIYKTHYNLSKSPIQLPQLPNCLIPVHFGDIAPFSLRVSLSAPFFICGPSQALTAVGQSIFLVLLLFPLSFLHASFSHSPSSEAVCPPQQLVNVTLLCLGYA